MHRSLTVGTNYVALRCQQFQESVDHHHDHREEDLAPALPRAIFVKLKRRPLLCC